MSERVLVLDIGSSRAHAGVVDAGRRACVRRSDFTIAEMGPGLRTFLDKGRYDADVPAIIAGGRSGLARKAGTIFRKKGVSNIVPLRWHARLPVRFTYTEPAALGADRIADALYAAAEYPGRNAVIIDSGTAITVDAVRARGEFAGGAILAGIGLQLRSLHGAAATLPALVVPRGKIPFPGTSTAQCMRAGAAHGITGALNHLVHKLKSVMRGKSVVLATGGAWHLTRDLVDFEHIDVPDMTLIGAGLYAGFLNDSGLE